MTVLTEAEPSNIPSESRNYQFVLNTHQVRAGYLLFIIMCYDNFHAALLIQFLATPKIKVLF